MGLNKEYVTLERILKLYNGEYRDEDWLAIYDYLDKIDIINFENNVVLSNLIDSYYNNQPKKSTEILNSYIYNKH